MNYTQLRAFHLVAEKGGFTAAAEAAGVGQPTLSEQVRALEVRYDVRLFERAGRSVRPTEAGRSLHAVTARLFAVEEEARALLEGTQALRRGRLRIAADSAYHAIPIMASLRGSHPGLVCALTIGNAAEALARLFEGEADVAVTAQPASDPRLNVVRLKSDRVVLFTPRGHPWARRRSVRLEQLNGQPLVLRERGSITREVLEGALAAHRIAPAEIVEVQTREGVREAVAAGFGVGAVFESEFGVDPRFHSLSVADADLAVAEYAVSLEERRRLPAVRAFFDAVEAVRQR
jgi:aminoethylphosphonate catabolism LysR family transcriptional regulator